MLSPKDISGVMAMAPTPCVEGGDHWSNTNSVDLEETVRMTENLIRDGVGGIAVCGTSGECAGLLWEEKAEFIDTIVQTARHRVPIFAGATSLGTKETIRQMRAFREIGADGAFIGLALWQTPTLENSIRWFEDFSQAVPDMPIMIYSNSSFFKTDFTKEFWFGVADRAPTVITNKIASRATNKDLEEIVEKTGDRIAHMPSEGGAYDAWKRVGNKIRGMWSTLAPLGPEPVVAFSEAIKSNDEAKIAEIAAEIRAIPSAYTPKTPRPEGEPAIIQMLNAQIGKRQTQEGGYINAGPSRAPYYDSDMWDDILVTCAETGKAWAELRKKYMKAVV